MTIFMVELFGRVRIFFNGVAFRLTDVLLTSGRSLWYKSYGSLNVEECVSLARIAVTVFDFFSRAQQRMHALS
jgi:hypothetical protein